MITLNIQSWSEQLPGLQEEFSRTGRCRVMNVLEPASAQLVTEAFDELDWRLVLNDGAQHIDLHPIQQKSLGAKHMRALKEAAATRAKTQFQYLFENYPLYDRIIAKKTVPDALANLFGLMNSHQTRSLIENTSTIATDFCDMQATRYRYRHFLNTHDDNVEGKNRRIAYVLSLTAHWKASWGGNLEFLDADGQLIEQVVPAYNALTLFKIPFPHQVSLVKLGHKTMRLAVTGWFRVNA